MRSKAYKNIVIVVSLALLFAIIGVPAYYWLRYPYHVQHAEQTSLSSHFWQPLALVMKGHPQLGEERLLAIDCEAYHGNWAEVQRLTTDCQGSDFMAYYHNLSLAHQGHLADSLMHHYAPFERALFLPVDENGNYKLFLAASEAWWAVGDLTMAEHASMLGLIFSPRHTGTRALRRLTEINIAQGDSAAAQKYLRMLKHCPQHRTWAQQQEQRLPGLQLRDGQDTLRLSMQYQKSLRNVLDNNPYNVMAQEYLFCLDLLLKDLYSFRHDVEQYGHLPSRLYEEAILILMVGEEQLRESWHDFVSDETYQDFIRFNQLMAQGNRQALAQYRETYWYYHQFAQRNEKPKQ